MTVSKVSDWLKELVSEIPELLDDIEDFSKALNEKEARYVALYCTHIRLVSLCLPICSN